MAFISSMQIVYSSQSGIGTRSVWHPAECLRGHMDPVAWLIVLKVKLTFLHAMIPEITSADQQLSPDYIVYNMGFKVVVAH